jgi:hypothetical protein
MKNLPYSIALLLVFLALLFNLERLEYFQRSDLNIEGFVYILVTVLIVAIILIPLLRRWSYPVLLILAATIYIIMKAYLSSTKLVWGGNQSYITIVELTLVGIAVILARNVAGWLEDFVNAVENITFAKLRRVHTLEEVGEDLESEMYRSRRYQHPLTVVVAKPEVGSLRMAIHRTVEEVQRSMMVRYVAISLMTRALYGQLRRTDWLLEDSRKREYVFVLPETRGERADIVIDRIQKTAVELGVSVSCGIATFPDDALTFESLIERAETKMESGEEQLKVIASEASQA